jgi:hypothetical protein
MLCNLLELLVRYYSTVGARRHKHIATPTITSANHVYGTNKIGFDMNTPYTYNVVPGSIILYHINRGALDCHPS